MKLTDKKINAVREYLCIPDDVIACTDIIEATYKTTSFTCWLFNRSVANATKAFKNVGVSFYDAGKAFERIANKLTK